jgi:hypothetical protein
MGRGRQQRSGECLQFLLDQFAPSDIDAGMRRADLPPSQYS